jgi:hypothetical protein
MNKDQKRITIPVRKEIDEIRAKIKRDTNVEMTYVQVFNYLIGFYMKNNGPRTEWKI